MNIIKLSNANMKIFALCMQLLLNWSQFDFDFEISVETAIDNRKVDRW